MSTFEVNTDQVTILGVSSGSIVVNFQIVTTSNSAATSLSSQVSSFISNPSTTALQSLENSLPSAAFQDPSQGITIDQTGSSSYAGTPTPITPTSTPPLSEGAIVGIAIGGVGFVIILAGLGFYLVGKKSKKGGDVVMY